MRRVLSIWLPDLAIERWAKSSDCPPDSPVVLTIEGTHGPMIYAATKAAAQRGAKPGARLTDSRALDPMLVAIEADPAGDSRLVQRLAKWASRWSPLVEIDGADGLRFDVTGVAHLFGGERELVEDIQQRFAAIGLTAQIAIAPTAAAACALARHAPCICHENVEAMLAPLHVCALRLDPNIVRTLERLGLKTIGALLGVPRLALARRFRGGDDVLDALDRALGRRREPLTGTPANAAPRSVMRLEEPTTHPGAALRALERLIADLVAKLQEQHLGARRLSFHGFRVDGSVAIASVATTIASREPRHLQRLLSDKVAALDPDFGFDGFVLVADWTETLRAAQEALIGEASGDRELGLLIDRLTVKLGVNAVLCPQSYESHIPERASRWVGAVESVRKSRSNSGGRPDGFPAAARPQRLLDRPEAIEVIYATPEGSPRRFIWRRAIHDIARVEGPERIAPEWWRQPSSTRLRDYYRVEDSSGRRYWIYRQGLNGDGRGGAPGWFIHGLFG